MNTRGWRHRLLGWATASDPLPGKLCDETPVAIAGKWQPRIPVHEVPEPRDDSEYDVRAVEATPDELAQWGAYLRDRNVPAASTDGPVTAYLRHLLDEITADRDQLEHANGLLVAKVRELESLALVNYGQIQYLRAALAHDTTGA